MLCAGMALVAALGLSSACASPATAGSNNPLETSEGAESTAPLGTARQQLDAALAAGDRASQLSARLALADAQAGVGDWGEVVRTLEPAVELARETDRPLDAIRARLSLATASSALGDEARTTTELDLAEQTAEALPEGPLGDRVRARVGNEIASDWARRGRPESVDRFEAAAGLAKQSKSQSRLLEATLLVNATRAALDTEQRERAQHLAERAARVLRTSRDPSLWISLGRCEERLERPLVAESHYREAVALAKETADGRSLAYGQGYRALLREKAGDTVKAFELNRAAVAAAERSGARETLYRWAWQRGRLEALAGDRAAALAAYRLAVRYLEEQRSRLSVQPDLGGQRRSFRESVGDAYFGLVDLLLRESRREADPARREALLREARESVELVKAAELRDYFRDECVAEQEARSVDLDVASAGAAIVYPVVLPDRLELLVTLPSGMHQYTVAVEQKQLERTVRAYRINLQRQTSREFLPPSQQLYRWLVEPYRKDVEALEVDTLVFVPGGSLRTIPFAALHDGRRFLIETIPVAVAPALRLVQPAPLDRERTRPLLVGLSKSVQGFDALASVPQELAEIQRLFGGELLLDEAFESDRLEKKLARGRPTLLHVASHAVFSGDPRTSFLLTHDQKLSFDELARAIEPTRFRDEPLDLLMLSACETAAGDERAALGLAGVGLRAGARSAIGSLWSVSDEATYQLVVRFYRALHEPGVSRAQALRAAQQQMLALPGFQHPLDWSPFLLISSWL